MLYSFSILIFFKLSIPHRCDTFNLWRLITVVLSARRLHLLPHTVSGTFSSFDTKCTATHPLILWKISSTVLIIGSARYEQTWSLHLILSKFHFRCFFVLFCFVFVAIFPCASAECFHISAALSNNFLSVNQPDTHSRKRKCLGNYLFFI